MDKELLFRIILEKPPAGVDFGLQKGGGNNYETVQKQRSEINDLKFEFPLNLKTKHQRNPFSSVLLCTEALKNGLFILILVNVPGKLTQYGAGG